MSFNLKSKWIDYSILSLSVFLIFCLIFDSYMELPRLIQWLGHWHPLILHFPIVLVLICVFLNFTKKSVPEYLLLGTTFSILITAISGFFLGSESQPKGDLLLWHQWIGGITALLVVAWYWVDQYGLSQKIYSKIVQVSIVVLIGVTGHYGGMVTHGVDFLDLPSKKEKDEIAENALVYKEIIQAILDDKCVQCHNPNKLKGELLMTNLGGLLVGGKSGNTLVPGDVENSELIKRLKLPESDPKHMPPAGGTSFTDKEIKILERWIALGASDSLRVNQIAHDEPLLKLLKKEDVIEPERRWEDLESIDTGIIEQLNSNYLTILKITGAENALSINAFLPTDYTPELILNLKPIQNNIVELDVSKLPLGVSEIDFISTLKNLERLEIDSTPVTDKEIEKLELLTNLTSLKIYNTNITDRSIAVFKKWKRLKVIHLWNTKISEEGIKSLQSTLPNLKVNGGIADETLRFFVSKEVKVDLKKNNTIAKKIDSIIEKQEITK